MSLIIELILLSYITDPSAASTKQFLVKIVFKIYSIKIGRYNNNNKNIKEATFI